MVWRGKLTAPIKPPGRIVIHLNLSKIVLSLTAAGLMVAQNAVCG